MVESVRDCTAVWKRLCGTAHHYDCIDPVCTAGKLGVSANVVRIACECLDVDRCRKSGVRQVHQERPRLRAEVPVGCDRVLHFYRSANCTPCLLYTSPSPRDGLLSRM